MLPRARDAARRSKVRDAWSSAVPAYLTRFQEPFGEFVEPLATERGAHGIAAYAFVRHPLERFFSGYGTIVARLLDVARARPECLSRRLQHTLGLGEPERFDAFVELLTTLGDRIAEHYRCYDHRCVFAHVFSQIWFLNLWPGRFARIGRFERFAEDLEGIAPALRLPNHVPPPRNVGEGGEHLPADVLRLLLQREASMQKLHLYYARDLAALGYPGLDGYTLSFAGLDAGRVVRPGFVGGGLLHLDDPRARMVGRGRPPGIPWRCDRSRWIVPSMEDSLAGRTECSGLHVLHAVELGTGGEEDFDEHGEATHCENPFGRLLAVPDPAAPASFHLHLDVAGNRAAEIDRALARYAAAVPAELSGRPATEAEAAGAWAFALVQHPVRRFARAYSSIMRWLDLAVLETPACISRRLRQIAKAPEPERLRRVVQLLAEEGEGVVKHYRCRRKPCLLFPLLSQVWFLNLWPGELRVARLEDPAHWPEIAHALGLSAR